MLIWRIYGGTSDVSSLHKDGRLMKAELAIGGRVETDPVFLFACLPI